MSKDATLQIRIDSQLKEDVEALYRTLGTSFAEAVRVFAQQSLRAGGMPFRPALKSWDEITAQEINAKLMQSEQDIAHARICTQQGVDRVMQELFHDRNAAV